MRSGFEEVPLSVQALAYTRGASVGVIHKFEKH